MCVTGMSIHANIYIDMIHFVNLTGLTRWNEAIVSPEDSKLSKETTYNAHSYITPSYL